MNARQAKKIRKAARGAAMGERKVAVVELARYRWWVKPLGALVRPFASVIPREAVRAFIARRGIRWPTPAEVERRVASGGGR